MLAFSVSRRSAVMLRRKLLQPYGGALLVRHLSAKPPIPPVVDTNKGKSKETQTVSTTSASSTDSSKFKSIVTAVTSGLKGAVDSTVHAYRNPAETWTSVKEVISHYWLGTKLLWEEIKMASQILGRVVKGSEMTRRERMHLVRTSSDLFRLVPFSVFVIVPFMELLLPFALKLFPNMLPSTFQVLCG